MTQQLTVPVTKLDLDLQNPRWPPQTSQRLALEKVLLSKMAKSLKLAEHIVEFGQNPIDVMAVLPGESGRYTVLEGNRRFAVLRVLNKPVMLDSLPDAPGVPAFVKRMKALAKKAQSINKTTVVPFDSRESAGIWINLKHTGENDGAGTVMWDGPARARFRNNGDVGLALLDFGKLHGWFDEEDLSPKGNPFPISTLNRLLGDPGVRSAMGLDIVDGALFAAVPVPALEKVVRHVVNDLATGNWNVTSLKLKGDRKGYVEQLPPSILPTEGPPVQKWRVDVDTEPKEEIVPPKLKRKVKTTKRTALIPKDWVITPDPASPRLEKIYHELRSLNVEQHPNAVAVLLRVFIELSLDDLIARESIHIPKSGKKPTLAEKCTGAASFFKSRSQLDHNQESIVKRLVGDNTDPRADASSITTLHGFVHSRRGHPIPSELMLIWDNISAFVKLAANA